MKFNLNQIDRNVENKVNEKQISTLIVRIGIFMLLSLSLIYFHVILFFLFHDSTLV